MSTRTLATALLAALLLTACAEPAAVVPTELPSPTELQAATSAPTAEVPTLAPPTVAPARSTARPSATVAASPSPVPTARPAAALGSEVLFLREGNLIAYGVDSRKERQVAPDVREFAATPDGALLALVRGSGFGSELWLVQRDGSGLRQLTSNERAEGTPAFAPDGMSLAFAAAEDDLNPAGTWDNWSRWCGSSQVLLLTIASGEELSLGPGCEPTFSSDGRRIAFASAPNGLEPGSDPALPLAIANTIRIVNRQGQNGWSFATAGDPAVETSGRLVYAPSFSPDGTRLSYQRFVGMMAESDVVYTELGQSLRGQGKPIEDGFGWLMPATFAPTGTLVAISEHDYGNARGVGGYMPWEVSVLRLAGSRTVLAPNGEVVLASEEVGSLPYAQHAAWSPDGKALVVQLPAGWREGGERPEYEQELPGELWRWAPDKAPAERLAKGLDYASPLLWLPTAPRLLQAEGGYQLTYPASWGLREPGEFEERTAEGAGSLISVAPFPVAIGQTVAITATGAFPLLLSAGAQDGPTITWPDGSSYREFSGTSPEGAQVAGAIRVVSGSTGTFVIIYRAPAARWPTERPYAQSLLAASGPQ